MKRRRAGALAFCLALVAARCGYASGVQDEARCIVATGHAGAVRCLEFDDRRRLLFSSGDDGTVRVWDAGSGGLLHTLRVTQLAIEKMAINPSAPLLAVIVTGGTGSYFLSVWDWEQERQVFRVPLREDPLFLRYSGMGNYLLFGVSSWQGLQILHAPDGTAVSFHPEGFGIVGFAEMSRSEKTLMTYQVSGSISYWDFASGQRTLDLPSIPYLSGIRISRDQRSIMGTNGSEIVVIDTVTGLSRGRAALPGAVSMDIAPAGDEVACVSRIDSTLSRWMVTSSGLIQQQPRQAQPSMPSMLCYGADALFLATTSGELFSVKKTGEQVSFGGAVLADITGFDASFGQAALASQEWVRVFSSDMLTTGVSPTYIRTLLAQNPFAAAVGLILVSPSKLLAWRTDTAGIGLASLDTFSASAASAGLTGSDLAGATAVGSPAPAFVSMAAGFHAPLTDLRVTAEGALGIETGGTIRIVDFSTGASRFDLRVPGVSAVVRSSSTEIIAGRNTSALSEGSLLRVNRNTGETVALQGRNVFTYGLLLDSGASGGPALYSVGIDASGATNLFRHDGAGFERETLLDSVPEEDLDVSLALDPDSHVLFATLGRDRVIAWDGRQKRTIALENAAPRRLAAQDHLLFALNKDSSVTVADGVTGARLAELMLFKDGEWCVLFKDGRYAASTGGDLHVRVFLNGSPVSATEDYRLRIPIK